MGAFRTSPPGPSGTIGANARSPVRLDCAHVNVPATVAERATTDATGRKTKARDATKGFASQSCRNVLNRHGISSLAVLLLSR